MEELCPAAWHRSDRHANNNVEADHGRLKSRLPPMRGLQRDQCAKAIVAGHAFVQNLRRGHYEHYELASRGAGNPAAGSHVQRTRHSDLISSGAMAQRSSALAAR
jgi:hypothetical protein